MDADDCGPLAAVGACSIDSEASFGQLVPVPELAAVVERREYKEGHLAYRAALEAEVDQQESESVLRADGVLALMRREHFQAVVQDGECMYQSAPLRIPADAVLVGV